MQTFLPYPDFKKSAECLDKQRCWKQVVETAQIISILENPNNDKPKAWCNHPAVLMWEEHIPELKMYFNAFLQVCKEKHKINTKYLFYIKKEDFKPRKFNKHLAILEMPWWFGKKKFHRAMRARLIEKNPDFYLKVFKKKDQDFNDGKYFWPDMKTKTFKII